jgi:hypothetical protein
MTVSFYVIAELDRFFIQDISRDLCNISFICFIMSTGIFLWTTWLLLLILLTKFILTRIRYEAKVSSISINAEQTEYIVLCLLNRACSFHSLVDMKFVGISLFMISNYFTGALNLTMKTREQNAFVAYSLLFMNSFIFTFIPFFVIYFCNKKAIKNQVKKPIVAQVV